MIFWVTFCFFLVLLILESVVSWVFISRSKKNHPQLWIHAGRPTVLGNSDLFHAWALNKYLIEKRYKDVDCDRVQLFADKMRLPFVLSYFLAVLSAVIFLSCFFIFGKL